MAGAGVRRRPDHVVVWTRFLSFIALVLTVSPLGAADDSSIEGANVLKGDVAQPQAKSDGLDAKDKFFGIRPLDATTFKHLQRVKFAALIRIDGAFCESDECEGSNKFFDSMDSPDCTGVFGLDCGDEANADLCLKVASFVPRTSFNIVAWNGDALQKYEGPRGFEPLLEFWAKVREHAKMLQQKSVYEMMQPTDGKPMYGTLSLGTGQLPSWFNCTTFDLRTGGDIRLALIEHLLPQSVQQWRLYPGRTPRTLHWVQRAMQPPKHLAIAWREEGEAEGTDTHTVSLTHEPGREGVLQRCLLPWGGRQIKFTMDTHSAFSWMHHDYLRWPKFVAELAAAAAEKQQASAQTPLVIDATCGSGWLPLLVKGLLHERVRVACSDINPDAVAQARANFDANGFSSPSAMTFTGDYLQPATEAGLLADVVYVHPPQDKRPPGFTERPAEDAGGVSIFAPDGKQLFFFERALKEAPAVLKPGGAIVMGVGNWIVDDILRMSAAAGWQLASSEPRLVLKALKQFDNRYCPAMLLEFRHHPGTEGQAPAKLCGEACGRDKHSDKYDVDGTEEALEEGAPGSGEDAEQKKARKKKKKTGKKGAKKQEL